MEPLDLFSTCIPTHITIDYDQAIIASDSYEFSPSALDDAEEFVSQLGLASALNCLHKPTKGKSSVQDIRQIWDTIRNDFQAAKSRVDDALADATLHPPSVPLPAEVNRQLVLAVLHLQTQVCKVRIAALQIQDVLASLTAGGRGCHPKVVQRIVDIRAIREEMVRLYYSINK